MSTELKRLKRLLEKSLRDAIEVELRRMRLKDFKVTAEYPNARVRMRIPEGILEMTGTLHGFLSDASSSFNGWDFRTFHVRRGEGINPDLDERSAFRAVLLSVRHSLATIERRDRSEGRHNPPALDALAVVRACLAAQSQLRWDRGEAGLRPLKASLHATFRTYSEHLARCEDNPGMKAMADHCAAKIRSISPVLDKVRKGIAAARYVERQSRKVTDGMDASSSHPPTLP